MKKIVLVAVGLLMLTACTHKSGDAKNDALQHQQLPQVQLPDNPGRCQRTASLNVNSVLNPI